MGVQRCSAKLNFSINSECNFATFFSTFIVSQDIWVKDKIPVALFVWWVGIAHLSLLDNYVRDLSVKSVILSYFFDWRCTVILKPIKLIIFREKCSVEIIVHPFVCLSIFHFIVQSIIFMYMVCFSISQKHKHYD